MPSLKDAVANAIVDGTRRNYTGFEGGILVDRLSGMWPAGSGARRRRSSSKKRRGGVLVDRVSGMWPAGSGARKRRSSGSKAKRSRGGAWHGTYMDFVREWHRAHPQYSWVEAMKKAKGDYHHMQTGSGYAKRRRSISRVKVASGARRRKPVKRRAGVLAAGRKRRAPRRAGVLAAGRRRRSGSKSSRMRRAGVLAGLLAAGY
jgi:hypothetical protein